MQQFDSAECEGRHRPFAVASDSRLHASVLPGLSAPCTPCSVSHDADASNEVDEDEEVPFGQLAKRQTCTSREVPAGSAYSSGQPSHTPMPTDSGSRYSFPLD